LGIKKYLPRLTVSLSNERYSKLDPLELPDGPSRLSAGWASNARIHCFAGHSEARITPDQVAIATSWRGI